MVFDYVTVLSIHFNVACFLVNINDLNSVKMSQHIDTQTRIKPHLVLIKAPTPSSGKINFSTFFFPDDKLEFSFVDLIIVLKGA